MNKSLPRDLTLRDRGTDVLPPLGFRAMNEYWSTVVNGLLPSAELTTAIVQTFFCGGLAAFISISVPEGDGFSNDFLSHLFQYFRAKAAYCALGGLMAVVALFLTPDKKFVLMQTITVGAWWPHFTRRLLVKNNLEKFIGSGKQVDVKEKRDA